MNVMRIPTIVNMEVSVWTHQEAIAASANKATKPEMEEHTALVRAYV